MASGVLVRIGKYTPLTPGHLQCEVGEFSIFTGNWGNIAVAPVEICRWWKSALRLAPLLGEVALFFFESVLPTEAAVERSFSHQGIVHSKNRNALLDENIKETMYVRMNYEVVFDEPSPALAAYEELEAAEQQ